MVCGIRIKQAALQMAVFYDDYALVNVIFLLGGVFKITQYAGLGFFFVQCLSH